MFGADAPDVYASTSKVTPKATALHQGVTIGDGAELEGTGRKTSLGVSHRL